MLTDHALDQRLEIRAEVLATAREAVRIWLDEHDGLEVIHGTETVRSAPPFTTRDGVTVENGVLLECRYRVDNRRFE